MSAFDAFQAPQQPATPETNLTPASPAGVFSKIGDFFGGMFGGDKTPAPTPPQTPSSTKQPTSAFDAFKSLAAKPIPTRNGTQLKSSAFDAMKPATAKTDPYFYAKNDDGSTIGKSDQLDTSGKPFLGYRNAGDTATTTDKTRVATTFDPRVAQKLDSTSFLNERAVSNRAALKTAMGGTYSDELDHKVALELSGSNDPSNLQIEPDIAGTKNTATDPLENSLAKDVANGKISLFDAQAQLLKAKGQPAPWGAPANKESWLQQFEHFLIPEAKGATKDEVKTSAFDTFKPDTKQQGPNALDLMKQNTSLSEAQPETEFQMFKDNISNLFTNNNNADRDAVVEAISKSTGKDANVIDKNLTDYTKALGLRSVPTGQEVAQALFTLPIAAGLISNPVSTVLGIAGWTALTEAEKKLTGGKELSDVVSDNLNLNQPTRDLLSFAEMFAKGKALHMVYTKAPAAAEDFINKLTKDVVTTYNLPKSIVIEPETIKNIFRQGTWDNSEQQQLYKDLQKATNRSAAQIKQDIANGVKIDIPAEKITTLVDKPYWSKLKQLFSSPMEAVKATPNKQGGFVKNPLIDSEGKTEQEDTSEEPAPVEKGSIVGEGKDLTQIEKNTQDYVDKNTPALIKQYQEKHGNVFNVDNMKDLIPDHLENSTLSEGFHKPVAKLIGKMVDTAIKENAGKFKTVNFMGGAPAVGKSMVASRYMKADITVDGTLADTNRSIDQMELALKKGYDVHINYVDDDPKQIIDNAITRAQRNGNTGRTVPIETIINALQKSRQNVLRANGRFGQGEYGTRFKVRVIDRRGGTNKIIHNGIDFLRKSVYSDADTANMKKDAYLKIQQLYEQGKITKQQEEGFTRRRKESSSTNGQTSGRDGSFIGEEWGEERKGGTLSSITKPHEPTEAKTLTRGNTPSGQGGGRTRPFNDSERKQERRGVQENGKLAKVKESSNKSTGVSFTEDKGGTIRLDENSYHSDQVGNLVNRKNSEALSSLEDRAQQLELKQEILKNNPASQLSKYTNKRTGELPEVLGGSKSQFGNRGDSIVTELGFKDSEQARSAYAKYAKEKILFAREMKEFKDDKKALMSEFKVDALKNGRGRPAGDYDPEILEANGGIAPPFVRGGIQAPEIKWSDWKDANTLRLGRDTMERNLEKVAGKDAPEIQKFLVDPIRANEVDRIHYVNELRKSFRDKMAELGIKRGSNDDELIQVFGEGLMPITELQKATKNWKQVQSAADYFRKNYERIINEWNEKRAKFDFKPVQTRTNYFRHFNDINQFTNSFGFLRSDSQLPTSIAGTTAFFRPSKRFSTAELHRTGNNTSYTAIGGMDNYIDSVSKQMYHIDSIQRGRALEKYLRQAAVEVPQKIKLPNFAQNLTEFTNLLANKAAMLDRSIESTVGRPVMKLLNGLSNLVARNIIVGNISVAMTHLVSIPINLATVDKVPFIRALQKTLISPLLDEPITHIDGVESSFLTRRYPDKYIQPKLFDKVVDTLSFIFEVTDKFKSRLTVASKFYEQLDKGKTEKEAMDIADKYAGRIIGDYSHGNRPNLMNTKTLKLLAQFQLGINDSMSVFMHDIPHWEEGNKSKIVTRFLAFMIFSYLFNQVYKRIRGSGKGIDPIDAGLTLTGLNDEGTGQDFFDRAKLAGGDLAGELPFTSIFSGSFPLATSVVQPIVNVATGKSSVNDVLKTLGTNLGSPVGGGNQFKKTVEGISAVNAGRTTTSTGATNTVVPQTPLNYVKGAIFGPSVFNNIDGNNKETGKLVNLLNQNKGQVTTAAEAKLSELSNLPKPEAEKQFDTISKSNPALAKEIVKVIDDKKQGVTLNERLVKNLGVASGQRAKYIADQLNKLSDKKSKADLWDRYIKIKVLTPQVQKQVLLLIKK